VTNRAVTAVGWSFNSAAEAERHAVENSEKRAQLLVAGGSSERARHYYVDRPMREPILRDFRDSAGQKVGIVTRNIYGALILNTARLCFIDVDLPERPPTSSVVNLIKRFFGGSTPPVAEFVPETEALQRAEAWANSHAPWLWRAYRTKAGLRFLAAHAPLEVDSRVVREAFEALGADPLYQKLCAGQKCFRARLTPKPWRCGYSSAHLNWPFVDAAAESRFEKWDAAYRERCLAWRTCAALPSIGSARPAAQFAELISYHDETSGVAGQLPLA
jgi:hypothetical protein